MVGARSARQSVRFCCLSSPIFKTKSFIIVFLYLVLLVNYNLPHFVFVFSFPFSFPFPFIHLFDIGCRNYSELYMCYKSEKEKKTIVTRCFCSVNKMKRNISQKKKDKFKVRKKKRTSMIRIGIYFIIFSALKRIEK